jgi:DNA-binding PadR family transcriptional regulator
MERKLLLLGILRQHGMHGYQLFEYLDQGLAVCTDLTKQTAYYLLNKMAEDGWISEEQTQEGNRPPRKVYRLTTLGESEFQRLLHENLARYTPANFPADVGLAFLDYLTQEEALALLEERRTALAAAVQAAQAIPEHPGSLQWVIQHQVFYLTAELAWLDQLIQNYAATAVKNSTLSRNL